MESTDADFTDSKSVSGNSITAATLDFSKRNTINNNTKTSLFDVQDIIPDGFQVNSVRLINEGSLDAVYKIQSQTEDPKGLCGALEIELMQKGNIVYSGKLLELSTVLSSISPLSKEDLVIFIRLNQDDKKLQNQTCIFNLDLKMWSKDNIQDVGFNSQKTIANRVSSGRWLN